MPLQRLHRVDEHALRAAERSNGLQATFANAVVDSSTRDAEQLGGVLQGDAAAVSWLVVRVHAGQSGRDGTSPAAAGRRPGLVRNRLDLKHLPPPSPAVRQAALARSRPGNRPPRAAPPELRAARDPRGPGQGLGKWRKLANPAFHGTQFHAASFSADESETRFPQRTAARASARQAARLKAGGVDNEPERLTARKASRT